MLDRNGVSQEERVSGYYVHDVRTGNEMHSAHSNGGQNTYQLLKQNEEIYLELVTSCPYAIGVSDFESGLIYFSNKKLDEMFGAPMVGKSAKSVWADEFSRNEIIRKFNQDGSVVDQEVKMKTISGEEFWVLLTWKHITYNNKKGLLFWLHDIDTFKKAQLQMIDSQNVLIDNAHSAGKAEVATSVLHNVGNLLNSVIFSYESLSEIHEASTLKRLEAAAELIEANKSDIKNFILNDPKGVKLLDYIVLLAQEGKSERNLVEKQLKRMNDKILTIRDVILSQQDYASNQIELQSVVPNNLIESTVKMLEGTLNQYSIQLFHYCDQIRSVMMQKSKVQHVLINLIKNATEELMLNPLGKRVIVIRSLLENDVLRISVSNNGPSIEPKNLDKIFNHGFSTKENGHGFGLHSCANYLNEMDGFIKVENLPEGGVCFTIEFPVR